MNDAGQIVGGHAFGHGQHIFVNQLAGVWACDCCAEDHAFRIGDDFGKAFCVAIGACTIQFRERKFVHAMGNILLLGFRFGNADSR